MKHSIPSRAFCLLLIAAILLGVGPSMAVFATEDGSDGADSGAQVVTSVTPEDPDNTDDPEDGNTDASGDVSEDAVTDSSAKTAAGSAALGANLFAVADAGMMAAAADEGVDIWASATISVDSSYDSGERISFSLLSANSDPNGAKENVTFRLTINTALTNYTVSTSGKTQSGGTYDGWEIIEVTAGEGGTVYLYYNSATGVIEYTLAPGLSIDTAIIITTPNGTTPGGNTIEIVPTVVSGTSGLNDYLVSDTTTVNASFSWTDITKTTASTSFGTTTTANNITYTITGKNNNNASTTGVVYTDSYTVTDTISFSGYYINKSDLTSWSYLDNTSGNWKRGGYSESGYAYYYLRSSSGSATTALRIYLPQSEFTNNRVTVTPVYDSTYSDRVIGITITYTVTNASPGSADLSDFSFNVQLVNTTLNTSGYLQYTGAPSITNEVELDAYSVLYDKEGTEANKAANSHHSEDDVTLTGTGVNSITKAAGLTAGTTTTSDLANVDLDNYVYFKITYTNKADDYDELYIMDMLPLHSSSTSGYALLFDKSTAEIVSIDSGGSGYTGGLTWDTSVTEPYTYYSVANLDSLYTTASYNGISLYDSLIMSKKFTNVTYGTTITIVYKIKVLDTETFLTYLKTKNISYTSFYSRNFTCVSTEIATGNNNWSGTLLGKANTGMMTVAPGIFKVGLTKTIDDAASVYKKDDPIVYKLKASNTGTSSQTIKLVDYWPGDGVACGLISGIPDGTTVTVKYKDDDTYYGVTVTDGTADISGYTSGNIEEIVFSDLVVPASGSVEITLNGTVKAGSTYGNSAEIFYPGTTDVGIVGSKVEVRFTDERLNISVDKTPYLVSGSGISTTYTEQQNGYKTDDTVMFKVSVTNNSNVALDSLYLTDAIDTRLKNGTNGLISGTYSDGTNSASGYVVMEYNGVLTALTSAGSLSTATTGIYALRDQADGGSISAGTGITKYYLTGRVLYIVVRGLDLQPEDTVNFYFFSKLDAATYTAFNTTAQTTRIDGVGSNYIYNQIFSYGWKSYDIYSDAVTSNDDTWITMQGEVEAEKSVLVEKTAVGVMSGFTHNATANTATYDSITLASSEYELSATAGQYIVYELKIKNTTDTTFTGAAGSVDVYGFLDTVPTGTTAMYLTSYYNLYGNSSGANFTAKTISGCLPNTNTTVTYSTNLSSTGALQSGVSDYSLTGSTKNAAGGNLTVTFASPITLLAGQYFSVYLIVRVDTDSTSGYKNSVGFIVDNEIITDANANDVTGNYGDTTKLVSDTATISSPKYYAGILKSAYQYSLDGITWSAISSGTNIEPNYKVKWQLKLSNLYSAGSFAYSVEDILPEEFKYVAGSAVLVNAAGTVIETIGDPTQTTVEDGTKLTWNIQAELAIGDIVYLRFVTEWEGDSSTTKRGLYTNRASIIVASKSLTGTTGEGVFVDSHTVTSYAQVNMLGSFSTGSYKTITNITTTSQYYNQTFSGETSVGSIHAVVGDTIRYTLNVNNYAKYAIDSGSMTIIDTLPFVGDKGVANASAERGSEFAVNFASALNLTVTVDGVAADYTVMYCTRGARAMSESEWKGTDSTGWTTEPTSTSDTIRIVITGAVPSGATVIVGFDAVVADVAAASELPDESSVAWNSFAYTYTMGSEATRQYPEPLKVGVQVSYGTIDVSKTVVDSAGEAVTYDGAEFTFTLYRRAVVTDAWELATDIKYCYEDDETVYSTGATGTFILEHDQAITLCAPTGYFYKVVETGVPEDYVSLTSDYITAKLTTSSDAGVDWENQRESYGFELTKYTYDGTTELEGIHFALEIYDEDSSAWVSVDDDLVTDAGGKISVDELPAGWYRLIETETLSTHQLLGEAICFQLPYDANASDYDTHNYWPAAVTFISYADDVFKISAKNYLKYELPDSGGLGARPFYIAGVALLAFASILLLNERRKKRRRTDTTGGRCV